MFSVQSILNRILYYVIQLPISVLYYRGPTLSGYGFYEGLPKHDICSRITGVPGKHWLETPIECADIIARKLDSIYVLVYFGIYMIILLWLLKICIKKFSLNY